MKKIHKKRTQNNLPVIKDILVDPSFKIGRQ